MRFLHTADWQIGMTRHFLGAESQARYTAARFEAIRTIGRIAAEEQAEFVVVCGDVFETNQVDRRTVLRTCEALKSIQVPVVLLPGNHDPLDAASVYQSRAFREHAPLHVRVLADREPVEVVRGVEVIGAPWTSKRPLADACAEITSGLAPAREKLRILIGHGAVDVLAPNRDDPALIELVSAEAALADGRIHYLALGDRHSKTSVGASGRVWYAGTPEPTDFDEQDPGYVLLVDVEEDGRVRIRERRVGTWTFLLRSHELATDADLDALARDLDATGDKATTALKLALVGQLSLAQKARLDLLLEHARDLYAAVEVSGSRTELAVIVGADDFAGIELSGFALDAREDLARRAALPGDDGEAARDALALLVRLAGRSA
jgi:DNA repair exonuclease SbcCD nuclease subunit